MPTAINLIKIGQSFSMDISSWINPLLNLEAGCGTAVGSGDVIRSAIRVEECSGSRN